MIEQLAIAVSECVGAGQQFSAPRDPPKNAAQRRSIGGFSAVRLGRASWIASADSRDRPASTLSALRPMLPPGRDRRLADSALEIQHRNDRKALDSKRGAFAITVAARWAVLIRHAVDLSFQIANWRPNSSLRFQCSASFSARTSSPFCCLGAAIQCPVRLHDQAALSDDVFFLDAGAVPPM